MGAQGEAHAGIEFIKALFGPSTLQSVYLCSLPNDKGSEVGERSVADRDAETLTVFINRWDRPGRGLYFCISSLQAGSRRNRENVLETPAISSDVDFKDIIEDHHTAKNRIAVLRLPPSMVVSSGHGYHVYYFLKEALNTPENRDRIEAVMRQLSDTLGGDMHPTHVAALMRLPGTHNTKGGQWFEVEVEAANGLRYELDELEEWLAEQSPVLTRKVRPKPPELNPYIAIAERLMIKPPIDVEQRLAAMVYQGAGDAAIHSTQLAVSSSLLSRGEEVDAIVALLLDATRHAAGDYGSRWNWHREERNIRQMCVSWLQKMETRPKRASNGTEKINKAEREVVDIAQARAARAPKPEPAPAPVKAKKFHMVAEAMLLGMVARDEELMFARGTWHYVDGAWALQADSRAWLNVEIERAARGVGIVSDSRMLNEARSWLERNPDLQGGGIAWDQHGQVPTMSGLVHPETLALTPASPDHRATWRVNAVYDPQANCPHWLQMLEDAFGDRPPIERVAVVATLQELLGAALIDRKPRGMRRALVLYGGPNSGKSQLLAVLAGLFGQAVISAPLAAIDTPHGMMPFQRRLPWVLDEAFNQSVWHLSSSVKMLIMGENIAVNIKNGPMLEGRFLGPIFWATNHPPQFKESTRAIVDRLLTIECRQHFEGRPAPGAAFLTPSERILAHELPGVLVWALEGLRRALARGSIGLSAESLASAEQIYRDSNLVAGFVEEGCEYDGNARLTMPDFCVAVSAWFAENKGETRSLPSNDTIGRALNALHDPRIATDRQELRDKAVRYVVGIRLNSHGLDYHKRGTQADLFEGKTVQTTGDLGQVNKMIPLSWDEKPSVVRMREAHAEMEKRSVTNETEQ